MIFSNLEQIELQSKINYYDYIYPSKLWFKKQQPNYIGYVVNM